MGVSDIEFHPVYQALILANKGFSYDRVKTSLPSRRIPSQIQILEYLRTRKRADEKELVRLLRLEDNQRLGLWRVISPVIKVGLLKKERVNGANFFLLDDAIVTKFKDEADKIKRWLEKS